MLNLASLELIDYLRSGALVVAFVFTAFADKKGSSSVWLLADVLACGAFGAALYLFPGVLFTYQVTARIDVVHELQGRVIGAMLLGNLLLWFFSTKDPAKSTFTTAWLIHRIVGGCVLLQCMLDAHFKYSKDKIHMKDQFLSFGVLGAGLWLLGNVIHLFKLGEFGRLKGASPIRDRVGLHLFFHFIMLSAGLFMLMMYPENAQSFLSLKFGMDNLHFFMSSIMNCFLLSSAVYILFTFFDVEENNRRAVLFAYILVMLLVLPWIFFYQLQYGIYTSWGIRTYLVIESTLIANAALGVFIK